MCGIVGIRNLDGRAVDPADLRRLTETLPHRGPDGQGMWTDGTVGFGHTRLSIIDLAGSPQPMSSVDDRLHLTFNGEILNYRQLRGTVDYPYRTAGDTEVILALHARRGVDGIPALRGQFAYGLHDSSTDITHLVRDRVGVLPLYYVVDSGRLVFGSEIKALLAVLGPVAVDQESLHDYLTHRSVPAPYTLFEGIRKVPPGHRVEVHPDGQVLVLPWWSLPEQPVERAVTPAQAVQLVDQALRASIDEALVADVPVGSYLSGGVDSSLVVALVTAARHGGVVSTYAAGFGDPKRDELRHARRVSELLGTDHHEVIVGPDDFAAAWRRLTWHRDAPLSEPADIAVHQLAQRAREDVKVVLSGEGSDELFAGYPKYRAARAAELVGLVPSGLRSAILPRLERALPARARRLGVPLRAMSAPTPEERLRSWFAPFSPAERAELLGGGPVRDTAAPYRRAQGDAVRRMLYADCHGWLSDNLLERGDRMTMAASVELRPPFLDARLVELAFSLPSSVKLRHGTTKWVVKEIARRHLPAEIVDRPKAGFRVPLDDWFRGGLRDMAWDMLTSRDGFVASTMNPAGVRTLLERHDSGRGDEHIRLWTLLGLEVWHDVFFRSGDPSVRPDAVPAGQPAGG